MMGSLQAEARSYWTVKTITMRGSLCMHLGPNVDNTAHLHPVFLLVCGVTDSLKYGFDTYLPSACAFS